MSENHIQLIDSVYSFIELAAEQINTEIICALGEDADWHYWAGTPDIPSYFTTIFSPEKLKTVSDLWKLREEANLLCVKLSEDGLYEWVKDLVNDYAELRSELIAQEEKNTSLELANKGMVKQSIASGNTLRKLQSDYEAYKKSADQEFRCLKAEIITSLRAINLCLIASLTTAKQVLTHRQRNFRMKHINQIISNEIDRFSDRKLTSYEDDF